MLPFTRDFEKLAETTRHIFIPLLQMYPGKYDIHQIGFFHVAPKESIPWPIYQTKVNMTPQGPQLDMDDRYSQKSFNEIVAKVQPDIVMGYGDMWMFEHLLRSPLRNSYRCLVYYTIDGQPYFGHLESNGSTQWGSALALADEIVVLSHFGKRILNEGCPEVRSKDIKVRYHPLDIPRYPHPSIEYKKAVRAKFLPKVLPPDAFICGWIGRNQFRKQNFKLWELLHYIVFGDYIECINCGRITLKEWNHSARKPTPIGELTLYDSNYDYTECFYCHSRAVKNGIPNDKFYMWFHMARQDPGYNSDLHARMWAVESRCIFTENLNGLAGISPQDLAQLMAAFDCVYYPSGGEGFGNPPFECIAAGTPIVFSNYSSHAEFCKFGGLPVRVTYQPELFHGIMRSVVDTNHAIEQMLKLIRDPKLKEALGMRGRQHVFQYGLPFMAPGWDKIFTDMMKKPLPIEGDTLYSSRL